MLAIGAFPAFKEVENENDDEDENDWGGKLYRYTALNTTALAVGWEC